MNLIKWQPNYDLVNNFDQIIDNIFNDFGVLNSRYENIFSPAIDITESKNSYKITADLPGFDKSNINISIDNGILEISTNIDREKINESERYMIKERKSNNYKRSFTIPEDVQEKRIVANYTNGTLLIELPKNKTIKKSVKQIKIN